MNKIILIISILSVTLLISCAEDRTYEYEQLTQHNIWMYEQMSDKYLWAEKLPEQTWKNYFATPSDYFATLIKNGTNDYASYIIVDSVKRVDNWQRGYFKHNGSYGFDFKHLTNDPTGATTKNFARVISVFDDSPASKAGLKRNDFIETFDGFKLSSKNISKLQSGVAHTFVYHRITTNTDTQDYEWVDTLSVDIDASKYVEDKAFPVRTIFSIADDKIGYLMCNRLIEKDDSLGTDYMAQMDEIMPYFKSQGVNQLVLDLRLCNHGSMEMARRLASYIIPTTSLGEVFAKTVWNSKYTSNNKTILFDSSLSNQTLGLNKVAVITSSYTQGAAEWLIKALQYVLGDENVIIVGSATKGQHCMAEHIGDYENMIHIYPAVAYVLSGDEEEASTGSISPTYSVDELNSIVLYDYGDIRELLLSTAIYYLQNPEPEGDDDSEEKSTDEDEDSTEVRRR